MLEYCSGCLSVIPCYGWISGTGRLNDERDRPNADYFDTKELLCSVYECWTMGTVAEMVSVPDVLGDVFVLEEAPSTSCRCHTAICMHRDEVPVKERMDSFACVRGQILHLGSTAS